MNRTPSTEPAEWTIEDVIHYIGVTDPALGQHADLFRKHVSSYFTLLCTYFITALVRLKLNSFVILFRLYTKNIINFLYEIYMFLFFYFRFRKLMGKLCYF